jgi:hypothetical protein
MVEIGQGGNEIPEHVRRCRKAMQQEHDRRIRRTDLAVKGAHPIDLGRPMVSDRKCASRH